MKRILIFLALTFSLTWTGVYTLTQMGGFTNPFAMIFMTGFMLIPAICSILTRLITKEGFKDMWLKPNFKGNIKIYLVAWFLPAILIIIGAIIYFWIYPSNFDINMKYISELYSKQGVNFSAQNLYITFIIQFVMGIFLSPVLNIIPTIGEELGWRGYLMPKLFESTTKINAVLLTGIIWGLWHAPMIAMGHNYGVGYYFAPWGGILAMIVFCIFVGAFFSYTSIKAKSAIPAAISHGALNGFAGISFWFLKGEANLFIGPLPVGILGGLGFLITGIICFYLIKKMPDEQEIK